MKTEVQYQLTDLKIWLPPILLRSLVFSAICSLAFYLFLNATPNLFYKEWGIDKNFEQQIGEEEIRNYFQNKFKTHPEQRLEIYRSENSYLKIKILSKNNQFPVNNDEFRKAQEQLLKKYNSVEKNLEYIITNDQIKNLRDHLYTKLVLMVSLSFGFAFTSLLFIVLGKKIQQDMNS